MDTLDEKAMYIFVLQALISTYRKIYEGIMEKQNAFASQREFLQL